MFQDRVHHIMTVTLILFETAIIIRAIYRYRYGISSKATTVFLEMVVIFVLIGLFEVVMVIWLQNLGRGSHYVEIRRQVHSHSLL